MKEKITEDVISVSQQISKTPISRRDYKKYGNHSIDTIKKYFGSWTKAIIYIFKVNPKLKPPKIGIKCKNCEKITKNANFCSLHCSASFNNRKFPKRKLENFCKKCKIPTPGNLTYCKKCGKQKLEEQTEIRQSNIR